jgi:hypothetical protein
VTGRVQRSIHVRRRVERATRAALALEAWRRQRAAELLHEAGERLEAEVLGRLLKVERVQ